MHIGIIGAGPGGYEAALYAAKLGARVTLIEERALGGTCLNRGCIPTKAFLAAAERLHDVKNAAAFGVECGDAQADFKAARERKDKIVGDLVRGIEYLMNAGKVTVIAGRGILAGNDDARAVRVTPGGGTEAARDIPCDAVILATGSVPAAPPIFQTDGVQSITSDEALALDRAPSSIIIAGGGVIGCEMGQFFRRMGSEVTIIEMMSRLLPLEDADCSKHIERQFKKERIKLLCSKTIAAVEKNAEGVTVTLQSGEVLKAEKLLAATGRAPAAKNIGLESASIVPDAKCFIPVDGFMQTGARGVYAIGDIVATPQLAHVAAKEGWTAVEHILSAAQAVPMSYKAIPRCVYTDPQAACVGITEEQAREQGIDYRAGTFNMIALGKARASGKTEGFAKLLADANDVLIGAALVGAHATEMITTLTLAVAHGLTASQLGACVFPHPALSEAIMEAAHDIHAKSIHKA